MALMAPRPSIPSPSRTAQPHPALILAALEHIGSGLVEAACKTLVAQRLKLSGMRWAPRGAQAILTMRGWDQSDRFDQAWALVAATYHRDVHVIAQIVDINAPRKKPTRRRTSG